MIREVFHTSNDAPQDVYIMIDRYSPGKPDAHGLTFDFSNLFVN